MSMYISGNHTHASRSKTIILGTRAMRDAARRTRGSGKPKLHARERRATTIERAWLVNCRYMSASVGCRFTPPELPLQVRIRHPGGRSLQIRRASTRDGAQAATAAEDALQAVGAARAWSGAVGVNPIGCVPAPAASRRRARPSLRHQLRPAM